MKKALLFGALTALLLGCNNAPTQKSNKDNEAYEACTSISDYRAYMRTYGTNGLHYKEAKNAVDRYVADSITKAEAREKANKRAEAEEKEDELYLNCTTIAACDKYLKEYPNGRYVYEVREMKAELEKKASIQADKQEEEAYKKCTTVAACNSYLKAYPNGKYAGVVNKKKIELEKKEAEAKKDSSKPTTTKKQETNPNNNNSTQPKKIQKKDNKENDRPKAKKVEKKK